MGITKDVRISEGWKTGKQDAILTFGMSLLVYPITINIFVISL